MADQVGPLGFIQSLIGQGISASEGLKAYREAGGSIRTQRWFRAFGEMGAEIARRPQVQAAPSGRPPSADEISRVGSTRPGAYVYYGGVMVVDRDTELTTILPAAVRTTSLIDYDQALQAFMDQANDDSSLPGLTVLGSFTTSVRELVPPEDSGGDDPYVDEVPL